MANLNFKLITDSTAISDSFDCGVESINKYVKDAYYPLLAQHAYVYNIIGGGESLGYMQFLFRDVELDYFPDEISYIDPGVKENVLPAIHIRFIAINKKYQKKRIGTAALQTAIFRIEKMTEDWPVSMITIDARYDLVKWYEEEGFKAMVKNKPGKMVTQLQCIIAVYVSQINCRHI